MRTEYELGIAFSIVAGFVLLLSIMPSLVVATECAGQSCDGNITVTVGNNVPAVITVDPVSAVTLSGLTTAVVSINFTADDPNGFEDLDHATAQVDVSRAGETTRSSTSCSAVSNVSTTSTFNCDVTFQFYDEAGAWDINASVFDDSGAYAQNITTQVTLNALDYVDQNVDAVGWSSVSTGQADAEADNSMTLQNGGNQVYGLLDVTASNSTGDAIGDNIGATAFSVNDVTASTVGEITLAETAINVSSILNLPTRGASETEVVFFYLDVPAGISADTYYTDSLWTIDLSA